jgi:TRAP transporter TAXI family solute receptor
MKNDMVRAVAAGLLCVALVGCSGQQSSPQTAAEPAEQTSVPRFWREAKTRIRFAGSSSNLTLISRYLGEGMYRRLGAGTVYAIYGARGHAYYDGLVALGEQEVDFAVITPPVTGKMAMEGKGYFDKAYPNLRAIAVYPQNDWIGCAVHPDLGVSSFEEIKEKRVPLKLATGPVGQHDGVGFLTEQILAGYGITLEDLKSWGGTTLPSPSSGDAVEKVLAGEANALCHEFWKAYYPLVEKISVRFLSVREDIRDQLAQKFGYQKATIPRGTYRPNLPDRDIPTLDFSDWVVITRSEVPDDIAYLAAKVAVEDRQGFEEFYTHQPERQRSMDTPMRPEIMWKNVGIPLHPGAEKYYREAGLMK